MEKENLAIRISGVKKEYRLGNIGGRTLQADLQSWFARKRGRVKCVESLEVTVQENRPC